MAQLPWAQPGRVSDPVSRDGGRSLRQRRAPRVWGAEGAQGVRGSQQVVVVVVVEVGRLQRWMSVLSLWAQMQPGASQLEDDEEEEGRQAGSVWPLYR